MENKPENVSETNVPAGKGKVQDDSQKDTSTCKAPTFDLFSLFFSHLKKLGRDV
jgi:hypothetical protein